MSALTPEDVKRLVDRIDEAQQVARRHLNGALQALQGFSGRPEAPTVPERLGGLDETLEAVLRNLNGGLAGIRKLRDDVRTMRERAEAPPALAALLVNADKVMGSLMRAFAKGICDLRIFNRDVRRAREQLAEERAA